jgi:hypothetical protein
MLMMPNTHDIILLKLGNESLVGMVRNQLLLCHQHKQNPKIQRLHPFIKVDKLMKIKVAF